MRISDLHLWIFASERFRKCCLDLFVKRNPRRAVVAAGLRAKQFQFAPALLQLLGWREFETFSSSSFKLSASCHFFFEIYSPDGSICFIAVICPFSSTNSTITSANSGIRNFSPL